MSRPGGHDRIPRTLTAIIVAIALLSIPQQAVPYKLPDVRIADTDMELCAEDALAGRLVRLDEISRAVDTQHIEKHRLNPKIKLSKNERPYVRAYENLMDEITFWKYVVGLKRSLLGLKGLPIEATPEADAMAKVIIETIYRLSQEYRVTTSAWIHNWLVTHGIRRKGHCYHYVDDLRKELSVRQWLYFDIHWGEAWPGEFRENNALVITAKESPFDSGLAIDAWRTAGKPFWTPVAGDRFPWREAFDVEIESGPY